MADTYLVDLDDLKAVTDALKAIMSKKSKEVSSESDLLALSASDLENYDTVTLEQELSDDYINFNGGKVVVG